MADESTRNKLLEENKKRLDAKKTSISSEPKINEPVVTAPKSTSTSGAVEFIERPNLLETRPTANQKELHDKLNKGKYDPALEDLLINLFNLSSFSDDIAEHKSIKENTENVIRAINSFKKNPSKENISSLKESFVLLAAAISNTSIPETLDKKTSEIFKQITSYNETLNKPANVTKSKKESSVFMGAFFAAITQWLERFSLFKTKSDTGEVPTSPRLSTIDPPSSFDSELRARSESVTQNIENQKKQQETINAGVTPSSNSPEEPKPIQILSLEELTTTIKELPARTVEELDEALGFEKTGAESKAKKSTEDRGTSGPTR